MAKVALIETKPSRINFDSYFDFDFDQYHLVSNPKLKGKPLVRDMDINIDIAAYDWIILVGADVLKQYTKRTGVNDYAGTIVDEKFLPIINPGMLHFKPEAEKIWESCKNNVIDIIKNK